MDIIYNKGGMCYLVWENYVMALGCWGSGLKRNWNLGGE